MSTSNYTKIDNTVVSGSALLSSLSTDDLAALNFNETMAPSNDLPVVVGSGSSYYMTADNIVVGINQKLRVDGMNVDGGAGAGFINLGSDLNSVAAGYLNLLNLTSVGSTRSMLLELSNIAQGSAIGNDITLQSGDGAAAAATALQVDGANKTATLFDSAGTAVLDGQGSLKQVVAEAVNVTSGSEQVRFNISNVVRS